jgi:hypothetical protein
VTDETSNAPTCMQIVSQGEDCCTSWDGVCAESAVWEHAEGGVRLCEVHLNNARRFGGRQLGYWMVGTASVSYPDGWTRMDDGAPLVDEAPEPAPQESAAPTGDPKVRPSGLVLP